MKPQVSILLAIVALSSTGCVQRLMDFTTLSTKNNHADAGRKHRPRVTGTDCVPVILIPIGLPSIKTATDRAIEAGGNKSDILVDGVIEMQNRSFIFGQQCYAVTGTPVATGNDEAKDNAKATGDEGVE